MVLLSGAPNPPQELRSIKVNSAGQLAVVDSYTDFSQVLLYGTCQSNGTRMFVSNIVNENQDAGLVHPYGLDFDSSGDFYVSDQHTDNVLRFYASNYQPMPYPAYINSTNSTGMYPGTFLQFGAPGIHSSDQQGVRGVQWSPTQLWVANEDIDAIVVVNPDGSTAQTISLTDPVGLYYDVSGTGNMFAGSKDTAGVVVAYDVKTYKVVQKYTCAGMSHPTGLVTYGGILYALDQDAGQLWTFNVTTTQFLGAIVTSFPNQVEQMALSSC